MTPTRLTHGPAPAEARAVVVGVHRRDGDPAGLQERLGPLTASADVAWVLPAAPGRTWYPERFTAALADNQPALDASLATLSVLADELAAAGVAPGRIVWAGFSQGACLVTQWVAEHPQRWGGLLAFSGGLIGPPGTAMWVPPVLDGMPAYFGVGTDDPWVPRWRVDETAAAFDEAGAAVTVDVFDDADHTVRPAELARAAAALAAIG